MAPPVIYGERLNCLGEGAIAAFLTSFHVGALLADPFARYLHLSLSLTLPLPVL
jgi:hypothetical protein